MHQFCLISAAGTSKAASPARSPRETDQQPAMKARRNAVQRRRLALELRGIERNMAALASERDREVRRLRGELQDVLAPLQPVVGSHLGHGSSRGASAGCRQAKRRLSDSSDPYVTAAGRRSLSGWPLDLTTSSSCLGNVPQRRVLQKRLSRDHKSRDAAYSEENSTNATVGSWERYDRLLSDVRNNLPSNENDSFLHENVSSKNPQPFVVRDSPGRDRQRRSFPVETKGVLKKLESSKDKHHRNILPSFLLKRSRGSGCQKNVATPGGGVGRGAQLKVGGVGSGGDECKHVRLHVPTDGTRFPTDDDITAAETANPASGQGLQHEQGGVDANDRDDKMAQTPCPCAVSANHKCAHFPCVRPCTYHSLGFHPDPSTHSWVGWMQLTSSRPHHRLVRDPEQGDPATRRYRSDEEPPADAPEFVRPRRLGKEEQLRLGTLHKKLAHGLQRPPSWNTNYGQPTPFKRLRNPVRLKPLGDEIEIDARKMEMLLKL